ncbi:MAG: GIY-YIG nuclease family protein [Acidobacteria bacterium]|nr:GIY-YIG nuclease family protein [Acidobacteriota bacterium]MBI3425341.1 GIY-YIG nuclease family protein [Acidobacteriota bacterium]
MNRKQELKRDYQQSQRPMGVYQIHCLSNEKILVGSSLNLPGIFNREKFALQQGGHKNKALQADWNAFGEAGFAFEILDELSPRPDPAYDYREDLTVLEDVWLEQLQPYGERGYNEPKKNREQRLQMIAAKQRPTTLDDD